MPEPLENAAPRGVRERGERGIEADLIILNHMVQYLTHWLAVGKELPSGQTDAGQAIFRLTCFRSDAHRTLNAG